MSRQRQRWRTTLYTQKELFEYAVVLYLERFIGLISTVERNGACWKSLGFPMSYTYKRLQPDHTNTLTTVARRTISNGDLSNSQKRCTFWIRWQYNATIHGNCNRMLCVCVGASVVCVCVSVLCACFLRVSHRQTNEFHRIGNSIRLLFLRYILLISVVQLIPFKRTFMLCILCLLNARNGKGAEKGRTISHCFGLSVLFFTDTFFFRKNASV